MLATGFIIGSSALTNFNFDRAKGYTVCAICGDVYQSPLDEPFATEDRRAYSKRHATLKHTLRDHAQFALSGRKLAPEAQFKLAAFGIIDLIGAVLDPEIAQALKECNSTPQNDAKGVAI